MNYETILPIHYGKWADGQFVYEDINLAIAREKQLKKWNRNWKLRIIIENNPDWNDIYPVLVA
jgi:predicted GIY-YIG superfamily endonuclease